MGYPPLGATYSKMVLLFLGGRVASQVAGHKACFAGPLELFEVGLVWSLRLALRDQFGQNILKVSCSWLELYTRWPKYFLWG